MRQRERSATESFAESRIRALMRCRDKNREQHYHIWDLSLPHSGDGIVEYDVDRRDVCRDLVMMRADVVLGYEE
jgi:hypothetical protein